MSRTSPSGLVAQLAETYATIQKPQDIAKAQKTAIRLVKAYLKKNPANVAEAYQAIMIAWPKYAGEVADQIPAVGDYMWTGIGKAASELPPIPKRHPN